MVDFYAMLAKRKKEIMLLDFFDDFFISA